MTKIGKVALIFFAQYKSSKNDRGFALVLLGLFKNKSAPTYYVGVPALRQLCDKKKTAQGRLLWGFYANILCGSSRVLGGTNFII